MENNKPDNIQKTLKRKSKIIIWEWKDLWHPEMGGAEVYITKLAEKFAKNGQTVIYLTSQYKGANDYDLINGVHYFRRGGIITQYVLLPLFYLISLKNKSDVLIEGFNGWPYLIPLLNKRVIGLIYHMQEEEYIDGFGPILGPLVMVFARFFLRLFYSSIQLVTISPSSEVEIKSAGIGNEKKADLEIIYPGVDSQFYESNEIPQKSQDKVNFVYLGRLVEHKRIDIGIELVRHLVKDLGETSVKYHIAGKGPALDDLQNLVNSYDLSDHVEFHGFVTEEEKKELFQYSHLHFLFSRREGWGITVIEAASQGTPTVCFDVPGLRDSVKEESGYIFKDKDELLRNFDKIYFDVKNEKPGYLSKVKGSFDWAKTFTWDNQLNKWVKLLDKIQK